MMAARLAFLPSLTVGAEGNLQSTKGQPTQKTYNIPVTMQWEVDLAWRLRGEKWAAVATYWSTAETERASDYLMNLSKVYRYTLSHLDHSMVSLQEELEFLMRYLALLKQRFGEGIQVRIADEVKDCEGSLPPAALQMLIENAIKHNEHTTARPLVIDVTTDGLCISVSNKKQPITTGESTHVGQHNIAERYRLLTDKKVVIRETADDYCVKIPLIK